MINLKNTLNEKLARGLKPLLVIGTTISKNTGEDTLIKLSDKFDRIDDEYAGDIASHLDMAIELMQDGYPGDATKMLKQFNKKCKEVLKGKSVGSVFEGKLTEGFADKYKSKSEMSPLAQYLRAFMDWLWATQEDALDVAGNYEDQDEPKLAKDWIQFSTILIVSYKKLRNFKEKFADRTKAVLPTSLQKKLDNAKFHKGPTTEDNYKKVLKEVLMLIKEIEKLK